MHSLSHLIAHALVSLPNPDRREHASLIDGHLQWGIPNRSDWLRSLSAEDKQFIAKNPKPDGRHYTGVFIKSGETSAYGWVPKWKETPFGILGNSQVNIARIILRFLFSSEYVTGLGMSNIGWTTILGRHPSQEPQPTYGMFADISGSDIRNMVSMIFPSPIDNPIDYKLSDIIQSYDTVPAAWQDNIAKQWLLLEPGLIGAGGDLRRIGEIKVVGRFHDQLIPSEWHGKLKIMAPK